METLTHMRSCHAAPESAPGVHPLSRVVTPRVLQPVGRCHGASGFVVFRQKARQRSPWLFSAARCVHASLPADGLISAPARKSLLSPAGLKSAATPVFWLQSILQWVSARLQWGLAPDQNPSVEACA